MKCTGLLFGCGMLMAWGCVPSALLAVEREQLTVAGEEIFRRDWSQHDPPERNTADSAEPAKFSDGLGPVFNAVSCVACHSQGSTGGGGPNDQNVRLLSVVRLTIKSDTALQDVDISRRTEFVRHPHLIEHDSTVLHRFSRNKAYADLVRPMWEQDRLTMLGWANDLDGLAELKTKLNGKASVTRKAMALLRTERNTPALFGAGLIDSVERNALERIARWQNEHYPELSGKIGGKFGWRGHVATLREFVLGACANELGLQVKGFPQANDVLTYPGLAKIRQNPAADNTLTADMTDYEIAALVSYVEQLPPPPLQTPKTSSDRFIWERGQRHFAQAQCNACHVERIGMVKGIYSDLLLHDLGPELFDPVSQGSGREAVGYFGFVGRGQNGSTEVSLPEQEWRTPPLWGVGNTAPYLHDGRAATIDEAIRLHGGEAFRSRQLYLHLRDPAQRELVAYVKSLGAPAGENILATLAKRRGEKITALADDAEMKSASASDPALKETLRLRVRCGFGGFECGDSFLFQPAPLPAELVEFLTKPQAP